MTDQLPEPSFIERDPKVIEAEVFQTWIDEGGAPLEPGQPEALFLRTIAYRETLCRIGIQEAAKQNLLKYAQYPMIDHLGALTQTPRLPVAPALTTCRWSLDEAFGEDIPVDAGSRVRTKDGLFYFQSRSAGVITAGNLYVDLACECTVGGAEANGYLAGQVSEIVDLIDHVTTVTNLDTTADGAAAESTARYQERLLIALDEKSSAGGSETYRFFALSASSSVADAAVISPDEGVVVVYLLSTTGSPSEELRALVEAALQPETVRPLTDEVFVTQAPPVTWSLVAELTLYANVDSDVALAAAQAAAAAFAANRSSKLHRSATLAQLQKMLQVPGVYDVTLTYPTATVTAAESQWLYCTNIEITIGGSVTEEAPDE